MYICEFTVCTAHELSSSSSNEVTPKKGISCEVFTEIKMSGGSEGARSRNPENTFEGLEYVMIILYPKIGISAFEEAVEIKVNVRTCGKRK